jgi:hypothetical protein
MVKAMNIHASRKAAILAGAAMFSITHRRAGLSPRPYTSMQPKQMGARMKATDFSLHHPEESKH